MYIILELEANLIDKLANLTSFSGEINLQVNNYRQTSLFGVFLAAVPYFDADIHDLAGLLQLGDKIWR